MKNLHDKIAEDVARWRAEGYPCADYPLIKVILDYQRCGGEGDETRRYLHAAQLRALETYWFLRLKKGTPRFKDLYKSYYEGMEMVEALSIKPQKEMFDHVTPSQYLEDLLGNEETARKKGIDAVYESSRLKYPSYIFALTMGSGKTVLIGSIVATEFVMSMAYPKGKFMKNALVFAPGTTIIESLRELSDIDYENILPPFHCKKFMANLKVHYTSSKNKTIDTQANSHYNLIVSNTEKIILRKSKNLLLQREEDFKENRRFDRLAQLPALGVFSDEAHHTYGNKAGDEIKRVRKTIDRLHERRGIVCVVNTTGTPYYKKQFLKDVVIWYGLSEGIRDGVLKSLSDGIKQYSIDRSSYRATAERIVKDFFSNYGDVSLPGGQKAKIAFYFNRQEDLDKVKGTIEKAMVESGESATCLLVNTQQSLQRDIDEFHRLNDPRSAKRVILLVGKGREGWNCPSLFACALITKQTSASNYVLQASARCLRRVVGCEKGACIYLDRENASILGKELQENFGADISLKSLMMEEREREELQVEVVKTDLPPLEVDMPVSIWSRVEGTGKALRFRSPETEAPIPHVREEETEVRFEKNLPTLMGMGERGWAIDEKISIERAAVAIAQPLHLSALEVLKALRTIYKEGTVAKHHVGTLGEQAEESLGEWEKSTETMRLVLALIHTKDRQGQALFEERQDGRRFHTFRFSKTRFDRMRAEGLFLRRSSENDDNDDDGNEQLQAVRDKGDMSFHYNPYNFDSKDERDTFKEILQLLNIAPHEIEGFYFTGSLTDYRKTDMWFEYKGEDGRFHKYFPDFVLYKKSGEWLIVEVKGDRDKGSPEVLNKAEAVNRLVAQQPHKIGYHVLHFPEGDTKDIKNWIKKGGS